MVTELDALEPVTVTAKLSSGTVIVYESFRLRQFLKMCRIITHDPAPFLGNTGLFNLEEDADADAYGQKLIALLVVAIMSLPDAADETIDFVSSLVKPYGLSGKSSLRRTKQEKENDNALIDKLALELENPDLDDLVTIISDVVTREATDLVAVGKRVAGMIKIALKTGQVPAALSNLMTSTATSLEDSAGPTTSSPARMDGTTTPSENSQSAGSDSVLQSSPSSADTNSAQSETI